MHTVFFGPWYGEFGWELMTWQAFCRNKAQEFDKAYVCSFPGMETLYEDFAEFIPHNHPKRALDWRDISVVDYKIPVGVDVQIPPHKQYKVPDQTFIRFGSNPIFKYNWLVHARHIAKGGNKNYPTELWQLLVQQLPGIGASIGTKEDYHVPGTFDLRGITLKDLMDYMAGSGVVIGQSSGVMHLATLCSTPIVVWGDQATYFGETLEQRYKHTWNPFESRVEFVFDDHWSPEPKVVADAVSSVLESNLLPVAGLNLGEDEVEEVVPDEEGEIIPIAPNALLTQVNPPLGDEELIAPKVAYIVPPKLVHEADTRHFTPETKAQEVTLTVLSDTAKILQKAVNSGKWLLTISYVEQQEGSQKLYHCWETHSFPDGDLIPSMEHLKLDMAEKRVNTVKLQTGKWQ